MSEFCWKKKLGEFCRMKTPFPAMLVLKLGGRDRRIGFGGFGISGNGAPQLDTRRTEILNSTTPSCFFLHGYFMEEIYLISIFFHYPLILIIFFLDTLNSK